MRQRGERHLERMAGVSERGVDHIETTDGPGILRSIDQIEKLDKVARRTFQLNDSQATGQITLNVLNVQEHHTRLNTVPARRILFATQK